MGRIRFINSESIRWIAIYLCSEERAERISICEEGEISFEFDDKRYTSFFLESDIGETTDSIYPSGLSLCIDHRRGAASSTGSTCFVGELERSGKIESFEVYDEKNLAHRDDKSKKINVFVPWHYDGSESYGVLYFFDAQNLFCDAGHYTDNGDPYGSWQLDILLNEIYAQLGRRIIAVGIDNADRYRDQELFIEREGFGELTELAYSEPVEDYSHGYIDGLSEFIRSTLHPYIKSRYNIDDGDIGIGGSSMGGIASFYCGMRELGFYRYILSYSPAFALYPEEAYERYFKSIRLSKRRDDQPYINIYCGGGDLLERSLLPAARAMKDLLVRNGYDESRISEIYAPAKPHNERSWRSVLPHSLAVLLDT